MCCVRECEESSELKKKFFGSQTLFIYSHHQEGQNDYITPYCACMHGIISLTATWLHYVIVGVKACALSPLPS